MKDLRQAALEEYPEFNPWIATLKRVRRMQVLAFVAVCVVYVALFAMAC